MQYYLDHFNKTFENKIRLCVMSLLLRKKSLSFNEIKTALTLTDGNLSSHMRALEKRDYIFVDKQFQNRKPVTNYSISPLGRLAIEKHINALNNLLEQL